jgi:hypothetical protein
MESISLAGQVDRVTVQLRGVPLGAVWLAEGDLVFTTLEPSAAYDGFAEAVRAASEPLWHLGFLQPRTARIAVEALKPRAEDSYELRDTAGRSLAVDFVNVVASPRAGEPPVVIVYRKFVHAAVASVLREPPSGGRSANA